MAAEDPSMDGSQRYQQQRTQGEHGNERASLAVFLPGDVGFFRCPDTVSYTHLTLPTSDLV